MLSQTEWNLVPEKLCSEALNSSWTCLGQSRFLNMNLMSSVLSSGRMSESSASELSLGSISVFSF